jgi:hypothetical protein
MNFKASISLITHEWFNQQGFPQKLMLSHIIELSEGPKEAFAAS